MLLGAVAFFLPKNAPDVFSIRICSGEGLEAVSVYSTLVSLLLRVLSFQDPSLHVPSHSKGACYPSSKSVLFCMTIRRKPDCTFPAAFKGG